MSKSALLVLDVQNSIINRLPATTTSSYLSHLSHTISAARTAQIPVLYVVVGFRRGHPELNPRNMSFVRNPHVATGFIDGEDGAKIHPDVSPRENDVVVTKHRVSAFSGTDIEVILRSLGVDTLVLSGIATSGAVLSTLRQAADLDYRLVVLEDLCLDLDPQVHQVLMAKVFPKQATVLSAREWMDGLG